MITKSGKIVFSDTLFRCINLGVAVIWYGDQRIATTGD
jgi:hypothetical protein